MTPKEQYIEEAVEAFATKFGLDYYGPTADECNYFRTALSDAWEGGRRHERTLNIDGAFNVAEATMEVIQEKEMRSYREQLKKRLYDWTRSTEAEYSGADLITREVIANQIVAFVLQENQSESSTGT